MLSNMILRDIVFRSRTVNKNICEQYDGIVTRITTIPDSTEDLVALMKFLDKLELKELQDLKVRYSRYRTGMQGVSYSEHCLTII